MARGRWIGAGWAALLIGAVAASASRMALSWDGSNYLFQILDRRQPWVPYQRYALYPLEAPTLLADALTDNVSAISFVFSATYALVPVLALWLSRIASNRRPEYFAWCAVGIALTLPAQAFMVSEAVVAVQLWWPLLVLVATGDWRQRRALAALLAIAILGLHPIAVPLLAFAGLLLVLQRAWWLGAALVVLAVVRYVTLSGSEQERIGGLKALLYQGNIPASLAMLLLIALAAAVAFTDAPHSPRGRLLLTTAGCSAAAGFLVSAALYPQTPVGARLAIAAPTVALSALFVFWERRRSGEGEPSAAWTALGWGSVIAYGAALTAASVVWALAVTDDFQPLLESESSCLERDVLPADSPFDHWSSSTLSLLLQGSEPSHVVLGPGDCDDEARTRGVQLVPFHRDWSLRPYGDGSFNLDRLRPD